MSADPPSLAFENALGTGQPCLPEPSETLEFAGYSKGRAWRDVLD